MKLESKYVRKTNWAIVTMFEIIAVIMLKLVMAAEGEQKLLLQGKKGVLLILVLIGISLILRHLTNNASVSDEWHARVIMVMQVFCALLMGFATNNAGVFCLMLINVLTSTLLYQNSKLFRDALFIMFPVIIFNQVEEFPGMQHKPEIMETIPLILVLFLTGLILHFFTRFMEFRKKEQEEQERSLDDMLKVVFVKCMDARNATRFKSEFLSNMSHEIRTPINSVLGMNEMILRKADKSDILHYADNIERSGNMLLALINDILDFSKIEAGRMELVNTEFQLDAILGDVIRMIQPRAEDKGLTFEMQIDPDLPRILWGDEVRLKQILMNILTNAVKYTREGTILFDVHFRKLNDSEAELFAYVKDTGQGMSKEDLKKLFRSFERFHTEQNRGIEGTGLGLAITKMLVGMMQGDIRVESEEGKGSTFHLRIPVTVKSFEPIGKLDLRCSNKAIPHKRYGTGIKAKAARILIVDDNQMNLEVAEELLKQSEAQIDLANSGKKCLELVKENAYDLIFIDHMMPEMDGVETLRQMRERGYAQHTPVIALTANAITGARETYLSKGFFDYLSKPVSGKQLEGALLRWLPKHLIDTEERTQTEQKETPRKPKADLMSRLTFLNTEEAMTYCMNQVDFYRRVLKKFVDKRSDAVIEQYYEQQDWDNYVIQVHALKGNAKYIGDMTLFEQAKALEMAGKAGETDVIRKDHAEMMTHYRELLLRLQEILAETEEV